MFKVDPILDGPVPVMVPVGRLDAVNSRSFGDHIGPFLEKFDYLVIDFSRCNYLSSAGIRLLISANKSLNAKGGCLFLAALPAEVMQVIEMTGLGAVFQLVGDSGEAASRIRVSSSRIPERITIPIDGMEMDYEYVGRSGVPCRLWNTPELVGLDELEFAAGVGSSAEGIREDEQRLGFFVTAMHASAYFPFNREMEADYRVVADPGSGGVFIHKGLSLGMNPDGIVHRMDAGEASIGKCIDALVKLPRKTGTERVRSVILADRNEMRPSLVFGLICETESSGPEMEELFFDCRAFAVTTSMGNRFAGVRFILNELRNPEKDEPLPDYLRRSLTIETIDGIEVVDLQARPLRPMAWIFQGDILVGSEAGRIGVETAGGFVMPLYGYFLARKLYTDSSRLIISRLHGGYSAQTFQVESFDHEGRKLRPTVLKIANRPMITREADRCREYSLPFILNNSAMVLGTAFFCDAGALRYNFVGIGGEESQLKWLAYFYESWPVDRLIPLFDKIFLRILKPWYGQPVSAKIRPFADHDPTFTFFPQICETAGRELGIDASEKYFRPSGNAEWRLNPYWFLRSVYPQRRNREMDYLTAICHGDLNMQNILLDEDMNVYLIDFSETRPRSAISDFARLEAIFMIEHAPMETSEDLQEMISFTSDFYSVKRLDDKPDALWKGCHGGQVTRNVTMALKMRQYALETVNGNPDLVPYLLALLEWVLPVVCYGSAPASVKMLSACIAGRICETLIDLEPD